MQTQKTSKNTPLTLKKLLLVAGHQSLSLWHRHGSMTHFFRVIENHHPKVSLKFMVDNSSNIQLCIYIYYIYYIYIILYII